MNKIFGLLQKPEAHRSLYILLLVATPFLLLQNYMQSTIGMLSELSFTLFDWNIPYVVAIAVVLVISLLLAFRRKITPRKLLGWVIVLFLFWVGQQSTDYYFNHKFYELQYNWHYFAYGIFAALNYRVLNTKHFPPQKIILHTFFYALAISAFDELVQIPLSNRIFDVGDIAKDLWGTMIGLFILYFIIEDGAIFRNNNPVRQPTLRAYANHPKTVFVLGFALAYIFMVVASLLTDSDHLIEAVTIPVVLFGLLVWIWHQSQKKMWRTVFVLLALLLTGTQVYLFFTHRESNISYDSNRLVVYKGIPLPYFDLMIYPNGWFRAVDKKSTFSARDIQTIKTLVRDILIIGTGENLKTGIGFPRDDMSQFIYNQRTDRGLQVIIMNNRQACQKFNQLKDEGKQPLLILHHD